MLHLKFDLKKMLLLCFLLWGVSSCSGADEVLDEIVEISPTNRVDEDDGFGLSDTLKIAHWNIGHFSLGKSANTYILPGQVDSVANKYHQLLDTLNVDVFGICEYNISFDKSGLNNTERLLFGEYPYSYIGKIYGYNCNAIFSKETIKKMEQHMFTQGVQKRYWVDTVVFVYGNPVHIVETHLDWNQGENGAAYRQSQMEELAEAFEDYQYVIICADYNSKDKEEYRCFVNRGYFFANDWITNKNKKITIDNIIVKGFEVLSCIIVEDWKLSDHSLMKAVIRMLNNKQ